MKLEVNEENIKRAIIFLNNALYFRDNSDYETAMFDALSELTGIIYDDFPNEYMEEMKLLQKNIKGEENGSNN